MDTLALKLVLTPVLIGAASLAGRKWGPAVGGWLVGLPFTSAPIALFLALGQGPAFAAAAAVGTMAGATSQAVFCLGYAWIALRRGPAASVAAGGAAFALSTAALGRVALPAPPLFGLVVAGIAIALGLMPAGARPSRGTAARPPAWDLPARMIVATLFVLLLTEAAPALGPRMTGLLAPFPIYAAVLTVFAHAQSGPRAAVAVLRGLLAGLFAFATFFLVLALTIERAGIVRSFATSLTATLIVQGASLAALRRAPSDPPAPKTSNDRR